MIEFAIFLGAVIALIVYKARTMEPKDYQREVDNHRAKERTAGDYHPTALKRAGRTAAWVALPPLGLWRSYRHGRRKGEQRIIDEIRKSRNPE
jgi:hypothetical protein